MKPHKHAELIKAWADGAEIEWKSKVTNEWRLFDNETDAWIHDYEYRIKPEPKPDVVKVFILESHCFAGLRFSESTPVEYAISEQQFIKCMFDGETGKLKSAEVLR